MAKLEQATKFFDQDASASKLFFLAIISIALCSFPPTSVFASIPMSVAFLLYGRLLMALTGIASMGALYGYSLLIEANPLAAVAVYVSAFIIAFLVSELVRRDFHPVSGMMKFGMGVVLFVGALLFAANEYGATSVKTQIDKAVVNTFESLKAERKRAFEASNVIPKEEDNQAFEAFVGNPDKMSETIYTSLPMIIFGSTFFSLWITLYVTLRNAIVWRRKVNYSFSLVELTNFRAPDYLVYPVIASLVLFLGADYGLPAGSEIIGKNLLFCLAVIYFFQGFGVYNALLKYLKITGFMKTLFIAFSVLLFHKYLAVVGLFDTWFDFRKFFKNKKKNEGDTI